MCSTVILTSILFFAQAPPQNGQEPASSVDTAPAIRAGDIAHHIRVLSSDAFGGRGPGTEGETRTINYLTEQLSSFGVVPACPGDTWTQIVPMLQLTPDGSPTSSFSLPGAAEPTELLSGRDVMLWSPAIDGDIRVSDSQIVFAGHGIVAPEFGWNDYEGIDARGKTVVVLVNDPGFRTKDPALFRGSAMTYYGRWTYKFEEAKRQGAAACLIVHEEDAASYGWSVVLGSWGRPQLQLAGSIGEEPTKIRGWITLDAARSMMAAAGADLDALIAGASKRGARATETKATFEGALSNRVERLGSSNVVGKIVGAKFPDEAILICAHWDHLGTRAGNDDEDNIFNGAVDNASGTAALLELAQAIAAQGTAPDRTVLFLATTAEEKGLLGSAYYATDPVMPLAKTLCGLNIDVVNTLGPMEDIAVTGYGASDLDDDLRAVAAAQGRTVVPEATPENGYYFRSDHFSLAKVGVPMLYAGKGTTSKEHGADWVTKQNKDFGRKRYHSVRDEFDASWDLEGAAQDVRLYHALVQMWANDPRWREWSAGSEFRAARVKSLAGSGEGK